MTMTAQATAVDATLGRLVGHRGIRHAVLAVESGDKTLAAAAAAGPAMPDGAQMRTDTAFHYASVTKLYTATVVMQLWEQGLIDLEAAISSYLAPDITGGIHLRDGVDRSGEITVRHLLSHTSGLPDYFLDTPEGDASFTDRVIEGDFSFSLDDVVSRVRRLRPHFAPQDPTARRQRARYSDTNFQLLGAIVEAVTSRSLQQVVEGQVLQPLGLEDTWFAGQPRDGQQRQVATMWSGDDVLDIPLVMASIAPEGGLIGTVADAITFLRSLLDGALFQTGQTLDQMQARWNRFGLPRDRTAIMAPGWPIEYGLGIKRFQLPRIVNAGRRAPTFIGHTGASGSWLFYCPDHDLYLAGTIDQTTAAGVPYRLLPRLVNELRA